ncbi:MAG: hypothetical protein A2W91_03970 [Bacteroidetes bacterium GWF2_38_335]|nr:MAG: hypothetical protein A2W91_03970 [Bacteroidetes bacterium GWF2_38_335]OFY79108.1 MAG: hypothetical protein A2281_03305 [Bacteroidetes bacterium RIFOXYA12_FULL_38_20]HBS88806.1 hypothetical protein [Bacteroidales bacterium]
MKNASGNAFQKTWSRVFPIDRTTAALEVLFLILIGALAIVLRQKLRVPMNMPGHHGIEVMALFVIGRMTTRTSIAAGIATLSAAALMFMPFMGITDPFLPAFYILMGILIDVCFFAFARFNKSMVFFGLVGGLAYMMIPLGRIFVNILSGYPYMNLLKNTPAVVLSTHFLFGFAGGILGFSMVYAFNRLKK